MTVAFATLIERMGAELAAPVPEPVRAFAGELARLGGEGVAAVLFYG